MADCPPAGAQGVRQTCVGSSVALTGPTSAATFEWSPGESLDNTNAQRVIASPTRTTTYAVASRRLIGDNLVYNPSFALGNTGYSSEYTNAVVSHGKDFLGAVDDCPDAKDTEDGDFMAVSGDLRADGKVWCQRVTVVPGASYLFRGRVASLDSRNTARLRVAFDGEVVGNVLSSEPQTCTWRGVSGAVWTNETQAVSVEVCLINARTTGDAYAFGVDDLSLGRLSEPSVDSFRVEVGPRIVTDIEAYLCPGERFTEGRLDLGPGERGTYTLRAERGCDSTINVSTVAIDSTPSARIIDSLCLGESVTFRGLVIAADTSICDTVATDFGCEAFRCTVFRFFGPEAISISSQEPRCADEASGTLELRPRAGVAPFSFVWDDGARGAYRAGLPAGSYRARIEDANGCSARAATVLTQPRPLRAEELVGIDARCADEPNGSFNYLGPGGTAPYALAAKRGADSYDPTQLLSGTYTLLVTDSKGCVLEDRRSIGAPDPPSVAIRGPDFIRLVDEPAYSLQIEPSGALVSVTYRGRPIDSIAGAIPAGFKPREAGDLVASVTDQTGCSSTDTLSIRLQSVDQPFFPTAFSPNGDDRNDVFNAVADPAIRSVQNLRIFDRWGNELYASGNCEPGNSLAACGWNGTGADGTEVNAGVYTYFAQLRLTDGREIQRAGEVTLFRQ